MSVMSPPIYKGHYTAYALVLLALVNMVNYMDRMLISVLMPSIQADLGLTDPQMGWLTGMAFAMFYGIAGIPIARLADVWVRKYLISISIAAWSLMTALSGATNSFATMLAARIGVGIGEAGCIPASHSLISDMVPKEKRAGALAVFTAGSTLGIMLGLALGGWLAEHVGWRWAFVIFGVPGLGLALLVMWTFREPVRGQVDDAGLVPVSEGSTWNQVLARLAGRWAYVHLVLGFAVTNAVIFGFGQWLPTYYARTFDLSMTMIGLVTGFGLGAGLTIGALLGGLLANRMMTIDMRWGLWMPAIALLVTLPFYMILLGADDYRVAFIAHFCQSMVVGAATGPIFATVQAIARPSERATASAVNGLIASLIGLGGGPLLVGYLSEYFAAAGAANSLRPALFATAFLGLWGVAHIAIASRYLKGDLERAGA